MSKTCKNCGAELAEGASFCPHCATVQIEKQPVRPPRRRHGKALLACLVLAALALAAAAGARAIHRPAVYEGGAELTYRDGGETYRLVLTTSASDGGVPAVQAQVSDALADGVTGGVPAQLYVVPESAGCPAWEDFLQKVEACRLEAVPQDGGQSLAFSEPVHQQSFPYAALTSDVSYTAACGTNDLWWVLTMKNGDTLRLRQTYAIARKDMVSYYPEQTPMDTLEQLQQLLDTIEREVPAGTQVQLYLPPVTYEGDITLRGHMFTLLGGTDGAAQTTIAGTVTVAPGASAFTELYGICLAGSGSGTGLHAYSSTVLHSCVLTGWDVGAAAHSGAWVGAADCRFEDNGIGLQFNADHFTGCAPFYPGNVFARNGVGVSILTLPGDQVLEFAGSTFSQNGTDIENPAGHPVSTAGAVME